MDLGITRDVPFSYELYQERINEGYEDLLNGKNIRGVLVHEH